MINLSRENTVPGGSGVREAMQRLKGGFRRKERL